jgi:hypothetical protein
MKKRSIVTLFIVLAVIILAAIVLTRSHPDISEETAICIGENSVLYMQTGCHACKYQEDLFGENYKYLNVINCWTDKEKCLGIKGTPTWIINEQEYLGARSIEELKELTEC